MKINDKRIRERRLLKDKEKKAGNPDK